MIRILTVREPWAWAIAEGYKRVENRVWGTDYRGLLAIHSGKAAPPKADCRHVQLLLRHLHGVDVDVRGRALQGRGRIVALCQLANVSPPGRPQHSFVEVHGAERWQWAAAGQYHWILEDVRRIARGPQVQGRLGLWRPTPEMEATLHRLAAVGGR